MNKRLAVNWDADRLRFVLGVTGKNGRLEVLEAGQRSYNPEDRFSVVTAITNLVAELRAGKACLFVCLDRGMVDATEFSVPPASADELPMLVRNLAQRNLNGLTPDTRLDYIAFPPGAEGTRDICAMALPGETQQVVDRILQESGCSSHQVLVATHALRVFSPATPTPEEDPRAATLVLCKGDSTVQLLVEQHGVPVLSRTLRVVNNLRPAEVPEFVANETMRTLLSVGSQLSRDVEMSQAIVVGSEVEATGIAHALDSDERFPLDVQKVNPAELIDGEVGDAGGGAFAPLVAALKEDALAKEAPIDFANPKQPAAPTSPRLRIFAGVLVAGLLVAGGWFFVRSQFQEAEDRNAALKIELAEISDLVKRTRTKRNLAKAITAWDRSRLMWLDELRDLTLRTPSSPDLRINGFSGSASGSSYVISFQGTGLSPDVIRRMETQLRDPFHEPKIPGISEAREGKNSVWRFQTTMRVKSRRRADYKSHLTNPTTRSDVVRSEGARP